MYELTNADGTLSSQARVWRWALTKVNVTREQADTAIKQMVVDGREFPPIAGVFARMCKPRATAAHKDFDPRRALPAPRDREAAHRHLDAMKESLK